MVVAYRADSGSALIVRTVTLKSMSQSSACLAGSEEEILIEHHLSRTLSIGNHLVNEAYS